MRANWTEEETELFKRVYPVKTSREMSELFPQYTKRQLITKAQVLGISKRKEVAAQSRRENLELNGNDNWTDEEKSILIEHFPTKGTKGVYELLEGRSTEAVIGKVANRMGIKRLTKSLMWEQKDVEVSDDGLSVKIKYKGW